MIEDSTGMFRADQFVDCPHQHDEKDAETKREQYLGKPIG
jgi:hypothetical protein